MMRGIVRGLVACAAIVSSVVAVKAEPNIKVAVVNNMGLTASRVRLVVYSASNTTSPFATIAAGQSTSLGLVHFQPGQSDRVCSVETGTAALQLLFNYPDSSVIGGFRPARCGAEVPCQKGQPLTLGDWTVTAKVAAPSS